MILQKALDEHETSSKKKGHITCLRAMGLTELTDITDANCGAQKRDPFDFASLFSQPNIVARA